MVEISGEKPSQQSLDIGRVEEDTWEHVDSQPGGPLHEKNLRDAREAAAKRKVEILVETDSDITADEEKPTDLASKIPEQFKPKHHLLHIFDEPLVGTVREGVLVGENILLADVNGQKYKVRGGFKPIYVSRTGFTIESIKDDRVSDCAPGTRFYRRPYTPSKPPTR